MIYFDNASTTKVDDEVLEIIIKAYKEDLMNPSSLHKLGFKTEREIKNAKEIIANKLRVQSKNLFFVPSGTIANNSVLNALDQEGKNIIISELEHKSVAHKAKNLITEIRYAKSDENGFVDEEDLLSKIDENTVLVSIVHVNNEIGSINDINRLAKISKEKNPNLLFHSDGIQAFKKIDISLDGIDFYTISSHKINGPKGIAGLYIKNPKGFKSLYFGGKQEDGLFSGTENVQAIIGFAKASTLEENHEKIKEINKYLREELSKVKDSMIISPSVNFSPYILNICFKNIGAEILLHYLEMEDIYISTGSACNKGGASEIIEALKVDKDYSNGCIRISLDRNSTLEETKEFIKVLKEKLEIIKGILG